MENSERDGNTRPPDPPLEKPVCKSGSNSQNWTWTNKLVPNRKRNSSRLYIVTLLFNLYTESVSPVAQLCLTLCSPMNHSMPGLPVHHQLPEFIQAHAHRVSNAIKPSHPLLSPSLPAPIMRNAGLEETQAGIKIARRNINSLRYADDTTLMAEVKRNQKAS